MWFSIYTLFSYPLSSLKVTNKKDISNIRCYLIIKCLILAGVAAEVIQPGGANITWTARVRQ